jgi:ParB family chromosome partitioning protein
MSTAISILQTSQIAADFRMVPTAAVFESKTNPRRQFGEAEMKELTDSVRQHGVLMPLLVRPKPQDGITEAFELIAGARRLRAAIAAALREVPVRVKEMSDAEVLRVQIIENLQRKDVHPLDEALGFRALMEHARCDVAEVAKTVSKSISYVYQRLKLADLIPDVQKAFSDGEISPGHAVQIARLQPKEQKQALHATLNGWPSVRALSQYIQQHIHLNLDAAPFKKNDELLLKGVGACTTCPKRTGANPDLFPDVERKNTCTDPSCYKAKIEAHIRFQIAESAAQGKPLQKVSREYYAQKQGADVLTGDKYKVLEGKKTCDHARRAIVIDGYEAGRLLTICATKSCKQHGPAELSAAERARQAREDRKRHLEAAIRDRIREAIIAAVPSLSKWTTRELAVLGEGIWQLGDNPDLIKRLVPTFPEKELHYPQVQKAWGKFAAAANAVTLVQAVMSLALGELTRRPCSNESDRLLEVAKLYSINVKSIEAKARKEFDAKEGQK